jgi:hypothetical protein
MKHAQNRRYARQQKTVNADILNGAEACCDSCNVPLQTAQHNFTLSQVFRPLYFPYSCLGLYEHLGDSSYTTRASGMASLFEQVMPRASYPQKAGSSMIDDFEDLPELCRDSLPL